LRVLGQQDQDILPGRIDGAGRLRAQQFAVDGRRERGAQHRLYVQVGHEKDVSLVPAELSQEFGLADPPSAVEDEKLSLIGLITFLEQLELCLAIDEHPFPLGEIKKSCLS
jgi:hypothetical protein